MIKNKLTQIEDGIADFYTSSDSSARARVSKMNTRCVLRKVR
jgi:hypothetical protein